MAENRMMKIDWITLIASAAVSAVVAISIIFICGAPASTMNTTIVGTGAIAVFCAGWITKRSETSIKGEITLLQVNAKNDIESLHVNTKSDIESLRASTKNGMELLQINIKNDLAALESRIMNRLDKIDKIDR